MDASVSAGVYPGFQLQYLDDQSLPDSQLASMYNFLDAELLRMLSLGVNDSDVLSMAASLARGAQYALDSWLYHKGHKRRDVPTPVQPSNPFVDPLKLSSWSLGHSVSAFDASLRGPPTDASHLGFLDTPTQVEQRVENTKGSNHKLPLNCTTCQKTFGDRYAWKRHEAQHLRPWVCMPNATCLISGICAICGLANASDEHQLVHDKLDVCAGRPIEKRSFRGRDKLIEHLDTHLGCVERDNLTMDQLAGRLEVVKQWESPPGLAIKALWCGFCWKYMVNWAERQDHVLDHLLAGASREQWVSHY